MSNMFDDYETLLYFTTWICAVNYSMYRFARNSYTFFLNYTDEYNDFTEGIPLLSWRRDKSDFEWEQIFYLLQDFYPYVLFYVSISELLLFLSNDRKVCKTWQILFIFVYICYKLGSSFLLILLVQPVMFYCARYINRSVACTWVCTVASLISINIYKQQEAIMEYLSFSEYEKYILSVTLCWMNLKCTSFYLENPNSDGALEFFSYCLYPPTLFSGPFISYEDFSNVECDKTIIERLRKLAKNVFKCITLFLFGNVCLHYVYIGATTFHTEFVEKFDTWSLCGFGYAMGQFFHIKYRILYGLSTSFASFESINVPCLPRCIGRIHLYSDMWRYFDQGLYKFLLKNIYVPVAKKTNSKLLTSFLCFTFVCIWHGWEDYVIIWSVLNYLGIVIEYTITIVNRQYFSAYNKWLGQQWVTRVKCMLSAPLLAISATSNFYFFGGREVGNVFFKRLFTGNFLHNLILVFTLYCCSHVSMALRSVSASKM